MHSFEKNVLFALVLTPFAVACSEAASTSAPMSEEEPRDASSGNDATLATTFDASTPTAFDDASASDATLNTATSIVVNEISAKGDDWAEIYNAGTTSFDLSTYQIADLDSDAGGPKFSSAVKIPSATVLAPSGYLVVAGAPKDGGSAGCPDGGQSYCLVATWNLSNKNGDAIYVLDANKNVVASGTYPANTLASGQTWGRLPNATGDFAANAPTPGATNTAP